MGFKRKKGDGEDEEMEAENRGRSIFNGTEKRNVIPSMIKNKEKRSMLYAKQKHEKKEEKQKRIKARDAAVKRALELGEEPLQKMIPRTIENTREFDETVCRPDDEELLAVINADEFNPVLKREVTPKILITSCRFHSTRGPTFISELLSVIPNSEYHERGTYDLKNIVEYAKKRDYTSLISVHTSRREPDALEIIGLPNGPTAHFKLSSLVLREDIKNHGNPSSHHPELILNHFITRLGNRIGRLFQSLFPPEPNFYGRRLVTFHIQRDCIFFRHHRYTFETKDIKQSDQVKIKPRLQECGPQFTLKLVSLQRGTFDTKGGEFEWLRKPDMATSGKSLYL